MVAILSLFPVLKMHQAQPLNDYILFPHRRLSKWAQEVNFGHKLCFTYKYPFWNDGKNKWLFGNESWGCLLWCCLPKEPSLYKVSILHPGIILFSELEFVQSASQRSNDLVKKKAAFFTAVDRKKMWWFSAQMQQALRLSEKDLIKHTAQNIYGGVLALELLSWRILRENLCFSLF